MAATVRAYSYTGAGPVAANADSVDGSPIKFGRDDNQSSAASASVPVPTAAGTRFSYVKWVGLQVTATAATSLLNRKVSIAAAVPTGTSMWWGSASTYTAQNGTPGTGAANYPTDAGTNGATPATITNISAWAALTTTPVLYDINTVTAGATGINGKYVALMFGVDFTYTTGGGVAGALALPNIVLTYDEQ